MITREFNLYLHAGHSIPLVINVNQYDRGEQWLFTLFNSDGTQYTPSSGAIVGIKSDNLGIINSGSVDAQGRVVINETQQMTAAVGKAVYELLVDDQTHGTANFVVLVEAKPGDNADLSESDYSLLQDAINSIAIAGSGAPAVATTASEMTDTEKIYLYAGTETGYTAGHWYYYKGSAWVDGGKYGGTVDATLTVQGAAADSKKVGDEISDLKSQITNLEAIPKNVKKAIYNLFGKALYEDDETANDLAILEAWSAIATFAITTDLSNCSIDNVQTVAEEDSEYITHVTANTGYTLDSVVVTMGGNDITSTVYSNGTITIPKVTGIINISARALKTMYSVTNSLQNVTNSNSAASVEEGSSYTATLTASTGYYVNTVSILMGGTDVTSLYYADGTISIGEVTGNISITASAALEPDIGLIYSNENDIVLDGATVIDTGILLPATYTIMVEWAKPITGTMFSAYNSGVPANNPVVGVTNGTNAKSMGYNTTMTNIANNKAVVVRSSSVNSGKPKWFFVNTDGVLKIITSSNNYRTPTSNLFIGAKITSDDGSARSEVTTGTIKTFKVYNVVCSDNKINGFLGVE